MNNEEINKQLSDLLSQFNLVAFKLQTLSESFDKLISKVDNMTDKLSETKERQLIDGQAISTLKDTVKDLDNKVEGLEKDVVNVRISMAEKLAWGSLGGGLAAGIIKVLEIGLGG